MTAADRLARALGDARWTIAVSGGVDSMTLASFAHRLGTRPRILHADGPAVPRQAGARLRAHARAEGWDLAIIDARELADPAYRANPQNRCYFCKSNLYRAIFARLAEAAPGPVASGTNLDDLGDFRPGLEAAREFGVRHPLVEAGIDKPRLRALARGLGLAFADIPAAPCLSSRVETGIAIDPADLAFIDGLETRLRGLLPPGDLRVRLRRDGVHVEAVTPAPEPARALAASACAESGRILAGWEPYRRGSAFLGAK